MREIVLLLCLSLVGSTTTESFFSSSVRTESSSDEDSEQSASLDDEVCHENKDPGQCKAAIDRWYYDEDKKECLQFKFGGCGGNGNRFRTKETCESRCNVATEPKSICHQPKDRGPCHRAMLRWYYDPKHNICRVFLYGGCEGNSNNFETEKQCDQTCGPVEQTYAKCKPRLDGSPCK
ncbi:hypothetical protein M514_02991 [Trichuris suis]|uniref:BPTI/Kunitz inhibitor domain-containing protein n=1 Tax=Trichuris suis TaxID=68888 RepID=A0A085MG67_9BILA|nr:hypothetical protein M513_02991 [Trichuris suis]KFD69128.1 hypothetical protein M514_02991 [Trichuris suis]